MAFYPKMFAMNGNISAASATTISVPATQIRIGDASLESFSNITLDVNSDSSWDFGQNISTWQPNTTYSVGDWVRPTGDGAYNASTEYATPTIYSSNNSSVIVSASSEYSGFFAYLAFDRIGGENNSWGSNASLPQWLKVDFGKGRLINKYAFRRRNSSVSNDPKSWVIAGSNDNLTWNTLHTVNNSPEVAIDSWSEYFAFTNTSYYRYYRMYITDRYYRGSSVTVGVAELKLISVDLGYKCTSAGTSYLSEPQWPGTESSTVAESGGPTWTAYYDYKQPSNRVGTDQYIYSVIPTLGHTPKLLLSANATYPSGYDATNSRKIGGFHCLCANVGTIANHPLTGLLAGDIIPTAVWDLKHRCANHNNAGMVYDDVTGKWYAIYLPSLSGSNAVSVYNATISDTLNWWAAVDYCANSSTRLLKDHEFTACATGSPEGTNILGSADPITTGGHVNTSSVRIISHIGCEDCTGVLQQWLDEQGYRFDTATAHTHIATASGEPQTVTSGVESADVAPAWTWKNVTGGKGQLYTQGPTDKYGSLKATAGSYYAESSSAGSLGRVFAHWPWRADGAISYRFCCESKEL